MFVRALALGLTSLCCTLLAPAVAGADTTPTGGTEYAPPAPTPPAPVPVPAGTGTTTTTEERPTVPGTRAVLLPSGLAAAPAAAPPAVQAAVWAANEIQRKPYRYGGGHRLFADSGYDCSGTVSYALHGAGLLARPLDSSSFASWGRAGRGRWITVYTNPGHAYAVIAGLRLDTSAANVGRRALRASLQRGPRWRPTVRPIRGFVARHPAGL